MGLFVLEDPRTKNVPGTATLNDLLAAGGSVGGDYVSFSLPETSTTRLKRTSHPTRPVILVPQPTDDPKDPLNWTLRRRDTILFIICLATILASTLSSILAADSIILLLAFKKPIGTIAQLTGYHLLGVAVAGFIIVPTARIWGKRHQFIFGGVIIVLTSIWAAASGKSFKSLVAARFFQGIGVAPFEALINAAVGDMYFVHERGKRMAVANFALFGGAFMTPVIVGKLTRSLNWEWSFGFVAIFMALVVPLIVLYVPETAYKRRGLDEKRMSNITQTPSMMEMSDRHEKEGALSNPNNIYTPTNGPTIKETLPLTNGRKTNEYFLKMVLRPIPLFFQPGIHYACLIQGVMIAWTVLIGIILAGVFFGAPLYFSEVQTGYMYAGAFIGATVGFVIAGIFSDWSASVLTRWNDGVYEPEFRLVLVVWQLVVGCAGLYGFGITSNEVEKYRWVSLPFPSNTFFAFRSSDMIVSSGRISSLRSKSRA